MTGEEPKLSVQPKGTKGDTIKKADGIEKQIRRYLRSLDRQNACFEKTVKEGKGRKRELEILAAMDVTEKKVNLLFEEWKPLLIERSRQKYKEYVEYFFRELKKTF